MKTQAYAAKDLLPIRLASLPLSGPVGVDVFLRTRPSEPALLFCAAHQPITRAHRTELCSTATPKLFIHSRDRHKLTASLMERLPELIVSLELPLLDRLGLVLDMTRETMREQLTSHDLQSTIENAKHFGNMIACVLGSEAVEFEPLFAALPHDHSHWTHATNVCIYATLLARQLGWSGRDLPRIAMGGLLHDLGKLEIDSIILNKPGKLDDAERRLVRQHPALGLQRLIERSDLCEGVMMMVYQHHERADGSGYPVALHEREIHPWGRLCAIADVFEALTSDRPHRSAFSTTTALSTLERASGTDFDAEMVTCWLQIVRA